MYKTFKTCIRSLINNETQLLLIMFRRQYA